MIPTMKVLIATPTAGHIVTTAYTHSLVNATLAVNALGGQYAHEVFNGSDIALARNFFAHLLLAETAITHLLFIDSDMAVDQAVFQRLFAADKPLAGVIYPEREMNQSTFLDLIRQGEAEPRARAAAMRFNVRLLDDSVTVRDGWCRVAGLGAGCLLIRRSVFTDLISGGAVPILRSAKMRSHLGIPQMHDFFGLIPTGDGDHLSEDYSFCQRVTDAGLEVWGLADTAVGHIGRWEFAGRFVDQLEMIAKGQKPT